MTSTATSGGAAGRVWSARSSMTFPSAPGGAGEPRFHAARIARHAIAADEVEERCKGVAGDGDIWRRPFGVGPRRFDRAQKIENADHEDERGILEQTDDGIDDVRQRHAQ